MSMEELLKILRAGGEFICTYGIGRIESYSIDKDVMSGYDSSGNYKCIELTSEDFDINTLVSVSKVTQVWSKDA